MIPKTCCTLFFIRIFLRKSKWTIRDIIIYLPQYLLGIEVQMVECISVGTTISVDVKTYETLNGIEFAINNDKCHEKCKNYETNRYNSNRTYIRNNNLPVNSKARSSNAFKVTNSRLDSRLH